MSQEEKSQNPETKGGKKVLIIVIVAAVLIIGVLVGVIIGLSRSNNGGDVEQVEATKRPTVLTEENVEEAVIGLMEEPDVPMNYTVSMNSVWNFPDGASPSTDAYVMNFPTNETPVYFDVIRNDTNETIYQSPVIPVGQELQNIVLDTDLDPGQYECTLTYHLIDDEQNTLTTVDMWLLIQIAS